MIRETDLPEAEFDRASDILLHTADRMFAEGRVNMIIGKKQSGPPGDGLCNDSDTPHTLAAGMSGFACLRFSIRSRNMSAFLTAYP